MFQHRADLLAELAPESINDILQSRHFGVYQYNLEPVTIAPDIFKLVFLGPLGFILEAIPERILALCRRRTYRAFVDDDVEDIDDSFALFLSTTPERDIDRILRVLDEAFSLYRRSRC